MRWYTQASLRQVDAAKAAFYPSFDIKGFFGFDSLHLEDLLNQSSKQMNLVPGLSLPIFDSGRLNAGLASARAQSNLMIAEYNGSVLNAVREVAQLGIELQGLTQQASLQEAKLKAVSFSMDSAVAHYKHGLTDKVMAMEARLPVLVEEGRTIQIRHQQLTEEISLIRALGGGYDSQSLRNRQSTEKD
jgi:multidrug efflux system outer membrane protein